MSDSSSTYVPSGQTSDAASSEPVVLTIIIVSYNTRDLTLQCLKTLFATTDLTGKRVVVLDNASHDGSADAIAALYPQVDLVRGETNIGFARANNLVAENVASEWMLLLNPDTEIHGRAIDNLLTFSQENQQAGITGGRTVFPDGSLNIASCWNMMTPWSLFCVMSGLSQVFRNVEFFNAEAIGGWRRDTVRRVDIVVGCFLMIRTSLWRQLGGFNARYFMYGEEADLCLRAAGLGYKPMITPDAEIMHLVGASSVRADKMILVWKAKATLIRDHWPKPLVPVGLAELWLNCAIRKAVAAVYGRATGRRDRFSAWENMWANRRDWLAGY